MANHKLDYHLWDKKKNQANKSKKKLTIAEALNFESHMQHANPNPNPNTNTNTNANSRSKRATKRQASLFSCYSSAHDLKDLVIFSAHDFHFLILLQDLRHLELEKEKEDSSSPREVLEAFMKDFVDSHHEQSHESETTSSTTKTHYHWTKFFKLWKKKSFKRLGSIPPLSVPKLPKWKSKSSRENQALKNIIGRGGFAEVYKGCLQNGQLIAVKKLTKGTTDEKTAGFLCELGVIAHVDHPNTAKLVGCCVEGEMLLVFQLSTLGSLGSLLHGSDKNKLDWSKRYKICLGIADGLLYLHECCHRRIIHRDIKAENILLTENFEPQICDFGLAKWLPEQWTHHNVSKFEGTFGYFAPEYFMHGIVDEKTDVFSFGVLLLEIITGRPAVDHMQQSVVIWVVTLLRGEDHVLKAKKSSQSSRSLQRTYSEELPDAQEYNSTKHLRDLKRFEQLTLSK
ncbi:hypothetical protein JHK84_028549 [Glycine max]|nr:hypothetical protein JHK86_028420 [Glycine max]KAG5152077.1 hypothetical protein JHK84_028549 [Glycine max]